MSYRILGAAVGAALFLALAAPAAHAQSVSINNAVDTSAGLTWNDVKVIPVPAVNEGAFGHGGPTTQDPQTPFGHGGPTTQDPQTPIARMEL
jgi:hypothetical protein